MSIFKKIVLIFAYFISLFNSREAAESVNKVNTSAELDEEILRRIGFDKGS